MGFRQRVFARRPARQQSQTEESANRILGVALLLLAVGFLLFLGMHYF